jgi:protein phosphatase
MSDEQEITAPFEAETVQAGWAMKSSARPRCYAFVAFGAKTDLGRVRENNEDKFDYLEPDEPSVLATKGRVYAVADGMGGHSAGQIASELAMNIFTRTYYGDTKSDVEAGLHRAVKEANAYVVDVARTVPGRNGMGATLTAAIIRDDDFYIAQVGDSRCYLLRDGRLAQLTEDHSWVAEQVRSGAMTEAEAEQSPFRNVITRSMGGAPEVEPDITAYKMQVGDRYLLCSDGLSGMVPAPEIAELLGGGSPSVAAWNLIERANQYGGRDNVTAFVLHVMDIQPWPEDPEAAAAGGDSSADSGGGHLPDPAPATPDGPQAPSNGHLEKPPAGDGVAAAPEPLQPAGGSAKGGLVSRLFRRA